MSTKTVSILGSARKNEQFLIKTTQFDIRISKNNKHPELDAPSPIEYVLAGYAGCINAVGTLVAKELNIDLNMPTEIKKILDKYPKDYHSGWIETSCMLEIKPESVKSDFRKIPDILIDEKDFMFPGRISKKTKGYGHLGYPQYGNKEIGRLINENTVNYLVKTVTLFLERGDYKKFKHHFLYKIPFLRTYFKFYCWICLLIIIIGILFFIKFF